MTEISPRSGKPVKSSAGKLFFWNTIYDHSDDNTPYMFRCGIGRLRFHIFYRGDDDPDCHDHPWSFWTFPLTSYVEEVTDLNTYEVRKQIVPAFRLSYRPAHHTHRVIGRWAGYHVDAEERFPVTDNRKIVTIVWRGKLQRKWGFLKCRDGKWCWVHWREYVLGDGKDAPCQ